MKEQIIQLDPHDEFVSIRDKLGWIRAPRVLLVWPEEPRTKLLHDKLDLILLQREATRRRAQLALITRDPVVVEHAQELGIASFASVEASHKKYWRTRRAQLDVIRDERITKLDPELVEAGTRLHTENENLSTHVRKITAIFVFGLTVALLTAGAYLILPTATVWLSPAANQVAVATTITADPEAISIDTDNAVIMARIVGVEVEGTASVQTTGSVLKPSQKARGIVLFTNLIPDQVTIPAGTIVRTSAANSVQFVTLQDATLPSQVGETVDVPVEAVEAGFTGNLPSSRINEVEGPLSSRVGVTNPEPTAGGDAEETRAVSEDDVQRVRERLLQQLQQRAYAEMQTDLLDSTEFIPIESLDVVIVHSETFTGYAGETRDEIELAMRVTVQGVAIDERHARQIVYARLADKVGAGYQIGADSLIFRRGEVMNVNGERQVTFIMQGAGDVSAAIDPTRVREMVRGVRISDATERLVRELPLSSDPIIDVRPSFWPVMPTLSLRIHVRTTGDHLD